MKTGAISFQLSAVSFAVALLLAASGCARREPAAQRLVAPVITTVAYTGSMAPAFTGGEMIGIDSIRIEDARENDLIVYWEEARQLNILHRCIQVRHAANGEIGLVCRGDANDERDWHVVTKENLIGRARRISI